MANSATKITTIPIIMRGVHGPVEQIKVVIDTTGADVTVKTPSADRHVAVLGITYQDADAGNVQFSSASTPIALYESGANQGVSKAIDSYPLFVTAKGEALNVQSSTAVAIMLITVAEIAELVL